MKWFLFIIVGFTLIFPAVPIENAVRCTDDFCLEYELKEKCAFLDISVCYNETLAITLPSPTVCNCCSQCIAYLKEGAKCTTGMPGSSIPGQMCGPGLQCSAGKCAKMTNPEKDPLVKEKSYECDANTGKCHCVFKSETETVTIFGKFDEPTDHEVEQCGCSVLAYKVQTRDFKFLPFEGVYQSFARCLPSGLYDPLQCYDGFCGCIDPYTGVYDDTVPRVAISAIAEGYPLCYNSTLLHHRGYFNECEAFLNDLQQARDLIEAVGEIFLFPYKVDCQPDGNSKNPITPEVRKAINQLRVFIENFSN